jgi:hypothetical protein
VHTTQKSNDEEPEACGDYCHYCSH